MTTLAKTAADLTKTAADLTKTAADLTKMLEFLATDTSFPTLTPDFFNSDRTFSPLSGISEGAKSDLLAKMLSVGFTPEQCDLAAKAMQTTDQVALTFFSHATVATTVVPDTAALAAEEVADAAAARAARKAALLCVASN